MIKRLRNVRNSKYLNISITIIVITIILFCLGMIILKYNVEGETNMPFKLSKISIISTSEGIDKNETDTRWSFDVNQSNDIFLYIDKNKAYGKTEAIQTIKIENIQIEAKNKEKIKIYKPDKNEEKMIFTNKEENEVQNIEYTGESIERNLKQLQIPNQGGLIAFRCSTNNIAEYKSNEVEIVHNELLKKSGVVLEDLETKITFDLLIKIKEGNTYKTNIQLELPIEGVIEKGTVSKEIENVENYIFKRVNN